MVLHHRMEPIAVRYLMLWVLSGPYTKNKTVTTRDAM